MHIRVLDVNASPAVMRRLTIGCGLINVVSLLVAAVVTLSVFGRTTGTTSAAPNAFAWLEATPSPVSLSEGQGAVVRSRLYVFGSFHERPRIARSEAHVYNPFNDRWRRIADLPVPVTHAAVVVDGTDIYLVGGFVGNNPGVETAAVMRYSTTTNTWSDAVALPEARGAGAAARIGRYVYFFGGGYRETVGSKNIVDSGKTWRLQLDHGTAWSVRADMPNPRNHLVGVALNGQVYALGGQHGGVASADNQADVHIYTPATNTWADGVDLPFPRGHFTASTFVKDGRIVIVGGTVNGPHCFGAVTGTVLEFDPVSGQWISLTSLPYGVEVPVAGYVPAIDSIVVSAGESCGEPDRVWVGAIRDTWETRTSMPSALAEVAGGIIGGRLYLVGDGSSHTLTYDLATDRWDDPESHADRPYLGHHHAAEVVGGKLFVFGGLGGAEGRVQIYDPVANTWELGRNMPFLAGSSSSAVIDGQIYVIGGIVNGQTVKRVARYDPVANTWTNLAQMPSGRNHAAAAAAGTNIYVFGGRGPGSGTGNTVANGFDTVQIYDSVTNTWTSSLDAGSTIAPLPQARGGTGEAVFVDGEFYVIGGETLTGAGATPDHVYNRVDVYNPITNTWRRAADMPTARHGIYPVAVADRIYVAGGGVVKGSSSSVVLEVYNPGIIGAAAAGCCGTLTTH